MTGQRWEKVTADKCLVLELVEVAVPAPMYPDEQPEDAPLARAELRMADGDVFQRYTTLEKARAILTKRGFRPTDRLVASSPGSTDDEPRRAI